MESSEHSREYAPPPVTNLANQPPPHLGESLRLGHEPLKVSVRGLFIGTIGLVLLVVGSLALMYWLVIGLQGRDHVATQEGPVEWTQENLPPEPHVEPNQAFDMQQFTRMNEELLDSYGWINKPQGIARIPVSRAIDLLSERGLSSVPFGDSGTTPDGAGAPSESSPPERTSSTGTD